MTQTVAAGKSNEWQILQSLPWHQISPVVAPNARCRAALTFALSKPPEPERASNRAAWCRWVNGAFLRWSRHPRNSVSRDTVSHRWLVQKPRQCITGLCFMPHELKTAATKRHQIRQEFQIESRTPNETGRNIGSRERSQFKIDLWTENIGSYEHPTSTVESDHLQISTPSHLRGSSCAHSRRKRNSQNNNNRQKSRQRKLHRSRLRAESGDEGYIK